MLISCNRLKKYIKDSDKIDWLAVWDKFSIRTAEVEKVEVKAKDMDKVVVAQILEVEKVPDSKKLHKLLVDDGTNRIQIICGAPNVKKGMKAPLVQIGGHVCGMKITKRKLAGLESFGMMCSAEELGFDQNCEGILELPDKFKTGKDIKDYLPLEDIIVEIDNKSLTNRPDLWGHYGIAREIAVIENKELLPLEIADLKNHKDDLDIKIKNPMCLRYSGIKIANIKEKNTPFDMQIFLYYTGMRSISLLVDLTNYVMLELGQPMHAFDAREVKSIEVDMAKANTEFITLDNEKRILNDKTLVIKKNKEYYAIAGVMGGLDSEIKDDTDSIILESACFDAATVRRAATALGLRTEASARYEKSLDPNMTILAAKRFIHLLKDIDSDIALVSNLTDVYPSKLETKKIKLRNTTIEKYMSRQLDSEFVINTFKKLGFGIEKKKDYYDVTVPTFRATKDISIEADLIEELARLYGYENIEPEPLKTVQNFKLLETIAEKEYEAKYLLATMFKMNEVHTYLWYKNSFLNKLGIEKNNIKLLGKSEDNILRDDISLSLLEVASHNLKNFNDVSMFEIATKFIDGISRRDLSILLSSKHTQLDKSFYNMKKIVKTLFKVIYNKSISFIKATSFDYYNPSLTFNILVDGNVIGDIKVLNSDKASLIAKKKAFVVANIDFDLFANLEKEIFEYESTSKYPTVILDYTILMNKEFKYEYLEDVLDKYKSSIIKSYNFISKYEDSEYNKYTIRYELGSKDKTLTSEDIQDFQEKFIKFIKKSGLNIIE